VLHGTAQTSAVNSPFTPDKIHHSQDLDPHSPALRQGDVGVDQKRGELIARIREEGSLLIPMKPLLPVLESVQYIFNRVVMSAWVRLINNLKLNLNH
jgi:hypothetical protein